MPTKRRRRTRHTAAPIRPPIWFLLRTGQLPHHTDDAEHEGVFDAPMALGSHHPAHGSTSDNDLHALWLALRDELVGDWVASSPGTRPWGWWEFEAPRWTGPYPERCRG